MNIEGTAAINAFLGWLYFRQLVVEGDAAAEAKGYTGEDTGKGAFRHAYIASEMRRQFGSPRRAYLLAVRRMKTIT